MTCITADRPAFLARLKAAARERIAYHFKTDKRGRYGTLADREAIAFMCGAAAAIEAMNDPAFSEKFGLTGLAFLVSARGADHLFEDEYARAD